MDIPATLREVFRDALDLAADTEVDGLAYRSVREWDSVGHMRLVAAIETRFDIMLDTDEVLDLSSFDKAVETVGRHLQA
jgi:acyl carrier protein